MKKFIKQVLPDIYIDKLRILEKKSKIILFGSLAKSSRLSALYFALFSNAFVNEQQGVLKGIYSFYTSMNSKQKTQYVIRRNIHRLEKALLMKPCQELFAVDYITETIDCYEGAIKSSLSSGEPLSNELAWAHDVLNAYFIIVGQHPVVDKAKDRFFNLPRFSEDGTNIPYIRDLTHPITFSFDDLLSLSHRRRSVRWYLKKPVERELLDKAMMVAALSPSACNRQPFEFRIFDDPFLVQQISALPGGTKGFYQNFPVIVVVVGKLGAFFNEHDRHLIYIDSALAAMAFMFALETLGLSSCAINWHNRGSQQKKIYELLGLNPDEMVIMLISVGYPDPRGMVACSKKKELELLRRFN